MRKPVVAGNWKMHGSRAENTALLQGLLAGIKESAAEVVVCPPFVYLSESVAQLQASPIKLGAQSICAESIGAFTGEISAAMLKDIGCRYVIVGHSERRALFHEDNALVARKFAAVQSQGLIPILCVGETLAEREQQQTFAIISAQLNSVIDHVGIAAFTTAIIAYEPVWAIGTGRTATPEQAQEVHAFIRQSINARDSKISATLRILYGGSVKANNAQALFSMPDVDGGLVGGASLKAEEFIAICAAAH